MSFHIRVSGRGIVFNNDKILLNKFGGGVKMDTYEKALQTMNKLFAKDYQFAMATVKGDTP